MSLIYTRFGGRNKNLTRKYREREKDRDRVLSLSEHSFCLLSKSNAGVAYVAPLMPEHSNPSVKIVQRFLIKGSPVLELNI